MKAINPRTGLLPNLHILKHEHGDPIGISVLGSTVSNPVPLGGLGEVLTVGGIGLTKYDAIQSCMGEAFERYASAFCSDLQICSSSQLNSSITGWPLFSNRLYDSWKEFTPFTSKTQVAWTSALDYFQGQIKHVPAALVYHPWRIQKGEQNVFMSTTNGLACDSATINAFQQGLFEILERDAFTLAWLSGSPLPVLNNDLTKLYAKKLNINSSWELRIIDLTCDTQIPIYLASLYAPTTVGSIFAVGAAARFNPNEAIEKAILEAIQTVLYIRHILRVDPNWHAAEDFSNLISFKDHARFYSCAPEYRQGIQYIHPRESEIQINATDPSKKTISINSIQMLTNHLEEKGIELYVKRLTTKDIYSLGYEVIRVLSPQLMPLHGHYQLAALSCNRLWKLSEVFSFPVKKLKTIDDVYPWPHPFA